MIKYNIGNNINVFNTKSNLLKFNRNFILNIALLSFIVVSVTFAESGLMKPFGLALFLIVLLKGPQKLFTLAGTFPPEIKFLNYWVIWSTITGVFVSNDMSLFLNSLQTVFLLVATVNLIYLLLSYNIDLAKIVLLGLLLSSIINFISVEFGFQSRELSEGARAVGLGSNPNSLGVRAVYSTLVLLLAMPTLNMLKNSKVVLSILVLIIFVSLILISGSRKSLISFLFIVACYLIILFSNRKDDFNFKRVFLLLLLFTFLIPTVVPLLIEGSILEERFLLLSEKGGIQEDIRYDMVAFGIELFSEHPFFGVGLNNYQVHSPWGMYSHNDYIESLTNTGLLGFILYQLFSIIIIIRSYKLFKLSTLKTNRFYFGMIIMSVLTVKLVGFGQIIFIQPAGMIILGIFASYTWIIQKQINMRKITI